MPSKNGSLDLDLEETTIPPVFNPTQSGQEILKPFTALIQSAHVDALPAIEVTMGGLKYSLGDYVRRISAPIWYGQGLADPMLPAWLENLRRIDEWWRSLPNGDGEGERAKP